MNLEALPQDDPDDSTGIIQECVQRVLLADGWHEVAFTRRNNDSTFNVVCRYGYDFNNSNWPRQAVPGVAGFTFNEEGSGARISGPLSSIIAVQERLL